MLENREIGIRRYRFDYFRRRKYSWNNFWTFSSGNESYICWKYIFSNKEITHYISLLETESKHYDDYTKKLKKSCNKENFENCAKAKKANL